MTAPKAEPADKYSTRILVRRLLLDEALRHWPLYAIGFALMAIAAGVTALTAYLLGTVVNETYVNKNFHMVVVISVIAIALFTAKGFATYGATVTLSRIGNWIIADNQRRMFDKLLQQNIGFFADRHSSEFIARLTTGAVAVSQVINLLITAIGRDLLSLVGLCIVMVVQDPVMSLAGVIVAPPAFLFLRKLIRRVRGIARMQFTGGTRIIEAMQEALQGMGMVKAFSLEHEMRRRLGVSVGEVEHESNKMARVSNRASPLMEMLGGIAVALATIYGGYRVIETGAKPGELVSFLFAFLFAYEPAKRLARLNIDLNNNLVGSASLLVVSRWPWQGPLWCLRVQLAQRFVGRIFLVDQSWGKVQVNSGARRAVVWPAWPPAAAPAEVGETISSFVRRLIASAVTRLKSGERTLCGFTRKWMPAA